MHAMNVIHAKTAKLSLFLSKRQVKTSHPQSVLFTYGQRPSFVRPFKNNVRLQYQIIRIRKRFIISYSRKCLASFISYLSVFPSLFKTNLT